MDMFMQNMAMQNMIKPGTQTGSAGSMGSAAQPGTPDGEGGNVFSSMIEQMNQSLHSSGKHPVSPIFPGKAQPDGQEEAAAAYAGSNAAQTLLWWNIPVPETISPVQTGQSETSMQPLTMASALTGAASADTVAADSAGYQTASDKMGIPNPGDSMASVHLTVESPDGQDQGAMPVNAENYSFADQGQTSGTYGNLQKSGISNAAEVSVDAVSGSKGDDIAEEKGGQDISPIKSEVTGEALSTHPAGASDVRENIRAGAAESTPVSETLHLSGTDRASDIQKLLEMTDKAFVSDKGEINLQLEPKNLGKITIKAVYEHGAASVLILCSDSRGAEKLSHYAADLGGILQERMGQPTEVVIDRQPENYTEQYGQDSGRENQQENSREHNRRQKDRTSELDGDFLHQLRLGIM